MIAIDLFYLFVAIVFDLFRGVNDHAGPKPEIQGGINFDTYLFIQALDRRRLSRNGRFESGLLELADFHSIGQIDVIQNDGAENGEKNGV